MSCILRADGKDFDVDNFVEKSAMKVYSCWRKGERRFHESSTNTQKHESSGIQIEVSNAEFSELAMQIDDAIKFLKENAGEVKKLVSFPGVEGAELDFGVESKPLAFYTFPAELVSLAGAVGVALIVSAYPICEDEV
jgi:hypothetical protein